MKDDASLQNNKYPFDVAGRSQLPRRDKVSVADGLSIMSITAGEEERAEDRRCGQRKSGDGQTNNDIARWVRGDKG